MATINEYLFLALKNSTSDSAVASRIHWKRSPVEMPRKRIYRGPPIPRKVNGKIDFKSVWEVSAQHEAAALEKAKRYHASRKAMYWRKYCQRRQWLRTVVAEYAPLIGTYAEAVEFGIPMPKVERVKPPSVKECKRDCVCRVCKLALQARTAKRNALQRRAEERFARKAERLAARLKRAMERPLPQASPTSEAYIIAHLLAGDYDEEKEVEVPRVGVARATSVRQVKTHWWQKKSTLNWADFYVGEPQVEVESGRVKRRRNVVTRPRTVQVESSPSTVFDFLKPAAQQRILAKRQEVFEVQMDRDGPVVEETAGNVVVQDAVEPETEFIGEQLTSLRKYCETDTITPEDTDRWITIKAFKWSKTDAPGTVLVGSNMPYDVVYTDVNGTLRESVLTNMLRVRQFIQTDLEIRITVNSLPFNVGQLQVGFLYAGGNDKHRERRATRAGLSQMDHVLIDAAGANDASLVIPYRNVKPYVSIRHRDVFGSECYIGDLYVLVLNQLVTQTGAMPSVDCTIMCRFKNCILTGMVPPGLTAQETQMFTVMNALDAARWLYQRYADANRDAPPNPHAPIHQTPTAVGNLACGTNYVEPLMAMRLDPKGQTPHPEGTPDSMVISDVTSRFGYVQTIRLSATQSNGTKLFCYDAAPILSKETYEQTVISGTTCYYLPPVAVVSQLFAQWRGEIEYRFDFVATRFHQARLLFAWIPGYKGEVTVDQAYSCAGMYFDLKEDNKSVTVKVPYIADRPWWPHRYANGVNAEAVTAPGVFCCFVINGLTYMASIPNAIDINVYMRGGSSFEVSVPVQPTIGLCYNPEFKDNSDVVVYAVPGYFPYYAGNWREVEDSQALVLRYGTVSDHIAQFYGLQVCTYYMIKDFSLASTMKFVDNNGKPTTGATAVLVPVDVNDGYGMVYLGILRSQSDAGNYFYQKNKTGVWVPRPQTAYNYDLLIKQTDTSNNTFYDGTTNLALVPTKVPAPKKVDSDSSIEIISDCDIEVPEVEGDNREEAPSQIKFETSSLESASKEMFGESFHSFKDLCRRYQPYLRMPLGDINATLGKVSFSFPMLPGGLDLHPLTDDYANNCRDGVIPIVLSGYRFFRGGLRFKMIPSIPSIVSYAVQVKPDRTLIACNARAGGKTAADNMLQYGYATSAQASSVNPVLSVEVPFYIPGSSGYLCRPSDYSLKTGSDNRFFSLGEMAVTCQCPASMKAQCAGAMMTVMYCLADDFSAHTFQGFPPMCFISDARTDS